jgi:hypothetical protein
MSINADRLLALLPAVYRVRDENGAGGLRALLEVIAQSMAQIDEQIEQLYDNHFIETAEPSVIRYLGTLVGARTFPLPTEKDAPAAASSDQALRAQVANTIRSRRRRGTAAALEDIARDITSWDAVAVEFFLRLATTQSLRHIRLDNIVTASLRDVTALDRVGTPFERVTRTLDVRRIATGRGTHNIPNVGVFLWPFRGDRLELSPAFEIDARRFLFHPLGIDAPLRTNPEPELDPAALARPLHLPLPITRRAMNAAPADYYGAGRSLFVEVDGVIHNDIVTADLSNIGAHDASGWSCDPTTGVMAIDPVLGRIAFPSADPPPTTVRVMCHLGQLTGIGGGVYERAASFTSPDTVFETVPAPAVTIPDGLATVFGGGTVEITDSGLYDTAIVLDAPGATIELRAANERRPHLALPADFEIDGDGLELDLNGLLISGAPLVIRSGVRRVRLRHCTLVPGRALTRAGAPTDPTASALIIEGATSVTIEYSIVGAVRAERGSSITARYSVIDANAPDHVALSDATAAAAGGRIEFEHCTVIGKIWTEQMDISNSILHARLAPADTWPAAVHSERRQEGCVRYSFVPPGATTPKRVRCVPDAAHPDVAPRFRTLRYARSGYAQLARGAPPEIAQGADDGGEMGAFVKLRLAQRVANLRAALPEQLRFGLEAGTFLAGT